MNLWQQTKIYRCTKCEATYLHDKAYAHNQFECPQRGTVRAQGYDGAGPAQGPLKRTDGR